MKPIPALSDDEFAHLTRRAVRWPSAPDALVQAAIDLWRPAAKTSVSEVARSALRLIQAGLRIDTWAQPPAALGVRDAGRGARHLLYSAMGRDIDLRVIPTGERFLLSGQILGPDVEGDVELCALPAAPAAPCAPVSTPLDAMSEFHFDDVPSGWYGLSLRVGRERIQLPPIDIRSN